MECDPAPRFTTLTRMQALIEFLASQVWLLVRSAAFSCGSLRHGRTTQTDRHPNGEREGQGGTSALMQNIIPFDAVWPVLSR